MSDREYEAPENLEVMSEALKYNRFLMELVVSQSPLNGAVLDFGAGIGTFATAISHQLNSQVVCLEPDPNQRAVMDSLGLKCVAGLQDLEPDSFDLIYSLNVLEHIEDDVSVLRQLRTRLRPNGKLLIYVPALPLLFSAMDARVGHVRRYRRKELIAKCQLAGFEVEFAHFADFLGVAATLAYKWVGPKDGAINVGSVRTYDRYIFPLSRLLDRVFGRYAGKNLVLVANRDQPSRS